MIPERLDPLDFKKQPTDDRHCIKCCTVPHNPQRSGCCNTLYCLPCSEENIICPVHKMRQSFTVDKSIKKSLMRATMKCPNWRTGCGFEDSVSKVYKQHLPECGRSCQIGRGEYLMLNVKCLKNISYHADSDDIDCMIV